MITPARRIWIYPVNADTVEIVILGARVESAGIYARLHKLAEEWSGWISVDTLVQDDAVVGIRMRIGPFASYADPVTEALTMIMQSKRGERELFRWSGGMPASGGAIGMVGTW